MSDPDWENRVWMRVPWSELAKLGAVAIAWPLWAIAANDSRRPPLPTSPRNPRPRDRTGREDDNVP